MTIQSNSQNSDAFIIQVTTSYSPLIVTHTVPRPRLRQVCTSTLIFSQLHNPSMDIIWRGLPGMFTLYLAFLRTGTILTVGELPRGFRGLESTTDDFLNLPSAWGLGLTLCDAVYQDKVMSSIIQRIRIWKGAGTAPVMEALTSDKVRRMYANTEENGPLRRLLVDAAARYGREADFLRFKQDVDYPLAFIKDVLVSLGRVKESVVGHSVGPQVAITTTTQMPPPPPSTQRAGPYPHAPPFAPSSFLWAEQKPSVQQPRSILRNPASSTRQVRFIGPDFGSDECVYHLHLTSGAPCWRIQ